MSKQAMLTRQEEAEAIAEKRGIYISPYRMTKILSNAARVLSMFGKADVTMTYEEISITLDIVQNIIKHVTEEEGELYFELFQLFHLQYRNQ